jgi:YYY domain-containing protein
MDFFTFFVVIEAIGILSFPLATIFAHNLRDAGYSLARPLGIMCISFVAWVLSSLHLLPLNAGIYAGVLALGLTAIYIVHRYPRDWRPTRDMFLQEGIFFSTFILATFFLMHKPEIFFGYSEDFMNSAFLQSILRTDFLPLMDPWYSGTGLSYYYFGHLAAAVPILLSGVKVIIGYNLAVAAVFAIGVQAAFGIGFTMTERRLNGFLAVLLIMVSGFPAGFVQLLSYVSGTDILQFHTFAGPFSAWLVSFDFTAASWVIPDANLFYPFFTFLQGDLHSHFLSIPFLLVLVGLCLDLSRKFSLPAFSAAILVTCVLAGMNIWILPVALFVIAWTGYYATRKKAFLLLIGLEFCVFLALLFLGGIGVVDPDQRTDLYGFLLTFGAFSLLSVIYLAESHKFSREDILVAGAVLVAGIISFSLHFPLALLALLAIPFFVCALFHQEYPAAFAGIALLLIVFCEVFFINDPYGPPVERMNTIMKLYLQAWVFWGIASVYFLYRIKNRVLVAGAVLVIGITLVHPFCSVVAMPNADYMGKTGNLTLDGMAWLKEQKPDEYEALCWLSMTADSGDVILEAPGDAYTYSSRIPPFTGLPTVIGWRTHEIMWGREWPDVEQRCADVDLMYTGDENTGALLAKYNVTYIFMGETERQKYGSELDDLMQNEGVKLVFQTGTTKIYRVI